MSQAKRVILVGPQSAFSHEPCPSGPAPARGESARAEKSPTQQLESGHAPTRARVFWTLPHPRSHVPAYYLACFPHAPPGPLPASPSHPSEAQLQGQNPDLFRKRNGSTQPIQDLDHAQLFELITLHADRTPQSWFLAPPLEEHMHIQQSRQGPSPKPRPFVQPGSVQNSVLRGTFHPLSREPKGGWILPTLLVCKLASLMSVGGMY